MSEVSPCLGDAKERTSSHAATHTSGAAISRGTRRRTLDDYSQTFSLHPSTSPLAHLSSPIPPHPLTALYHAFYPFAKEGKVPERRSAQLQPGVRRTALTSLVVCLDRQLAPSPTVDE